MDVRLKSIEAQGDVAPQGQDVVHFKRLKIDVLARVSENEERFELLLDQRARLFRIRTLETADITAYRVGTAIIYKMGTYLPRPVGHYVLKVSNEGNIADPRSSEWIVLDIDLVAGLLHRIKEHKWFAEPEVAPIPEPLLELRAELVESVGRCVAKAGAIWDKTGNLRRNVILRLEHAIWQAHRDRFMDLAEDHAERSIFASFFDLTDQYERVWSIAISGSKERPDYTQPPEGWKVGLSGPAVGELRKLLDIMRRLAKEVYDGYATPDVEPFDR